MLKYFRQCSSIIYDVEVLESEHDIFEMNLWRDFYVMMLICVLSLRCLCGGSSRNERKKQIGRDYCKQKRLKDGGNGEVEYNSFLWSVEREGSPPTYLFGTIHAPSHLVWRYIPQNSQAALLDASHVYTEVDLRDPKTITAIQKCRQLPGNLTIKDVLPTKLFQKFRRVLSRFKVRSKIWKEKLIETLKMYPMQLYNDEDLYKQYFRLKPMWLTSTILQQWNRFFIKQQLLQMKRPYPHLSLDSELVRLASDTYKGGIEEVSSHCDPMDRLGTDKVNLAFNVTLDALDEKFSGRFHMKDNDIRHVINLYKCGDPMNTNRLESLFRDLVGEDMEQKLAEIDEYLSRELMLKRNIKMADRIAKMLNSSEYNTARMFFAVGAAHLLGNDSVVTFLRKQGYKVRHIKPKDDIPATIKIAQVLKRNKNQEKNNSNFWWKPDNSGAKIEKTDDIEGDTDQRPNVIFITKYEKNYVYYYNGCTRTRPPSVMSSLLLTVMATVLVWVLSAGS